MLCVGPHLPCRTLRVTHLFCVAPHLPCHTLRVTLVARDVTFVLSHPPRQTCCVWYSHLPSASTSPFASFREYPPLATWPAAALACSHHPHFCISTRLHIGRPSLLARTRSA
eukprot:366531-Chlamydomonas_euryale.AAC.2